MTNADGVRSLRHRPFFSPLLGQGGPLGTQHDYFSIERLHSDTQVDAKNVSEPKQPWYREGLRFECTQCGNCCSGAPGVVWVDDAEIAALAAALDLDDESFRSRFVRKVGRRLSLVEYPDGDCVFLDPESRGCLVYEARPIQCRTWPFWESNLESPETWKETCEKCPGSGKGRVYSLSEITVRMNQRSL